MVVLNCPLSVLEVDFHVACSLFCQTSAPSVQCLCTPYPDDCVVFWELMSPQRPPKDVRRYTFLTKRSFSLLGFTVSESYTRALHEPYGRTLDTL